MHKNYIVCSHAYGEFGAEPVLIAVCATLQLATELVKKLEELATEEDASGDYWHSYHTIHKHHVAETVVDALLHHPQLIVQTQTLAEQKGNDNE